MRSSACLITTGQLNAQADAEHARSPSTVAATAIARVTMRGLLERWSEERCEPPADAPTVIPIQRESSTRARRSRSRTARRGQSRSHPAHRYGGHRGNNGAVQSHRRAHILDERHRRGCRRRHRCQRRAVRGGREIEAHGLFDGCPFGASNPAAEANAPRSHTEEGPMRRLHLAALTVAVLFGACLTAGAQTNYSKVLVGKWEGSVHFPASRDNPNRTLIIESVSTVTVL